MKLTYYFRVRDTANNWHHAEIEAESSKSAWDQLHSKYWAILEVHLDKTVGPGGVTYYA